MEDLATRIREELNTYQSEVAERLQELQSQGLISQTELKKIVIDAEITGKAVIEALATQEQYTEEATEMYVYSLFNRYKNQVEKKIRGIEEEQKSIEILINGQKVPIYFENEVGKLIDPSQIEKEITVNFLENALENPVKRVTIVVGDMNRDIRLTTEETHRGFNNQVHKIRAEEDKQRIQSIYQYFGAAISQLVNSNYPEDIKEISKSKLLEEMQSRLGERIKIVKQKTNKQSFWSNFFNVIM
jgi:transcriptional regulator with XRE-family HTH domain